MLYLHILSHKREEESLGETCWHMFPCFSLKHAVQYGGREFSNTVSQPFILNDERLIGQSNHRMPVAAEKRVEGGTASPLIFLSLRDEGKVESLDLTKRDPCRQSKDFNNEKKNGAFLCSHPKVGVAFHSRFQKREKRKFRRRKTKQNKTINYQSSQKGTPLAEAPNQNQHFSSILTLAHAYSKKPFCHNKKIL